jgi:ribosomal-protein-alanine N-acetyltransferase
MRWWDVQAVQALDAELFGPTAWTPATFWSELAAGPTRWYVVAESIGPDDAGALAGHADASGHAGVLAGHADASGYAGVLAGYAGLLVPGPEADVQTIAVAPYAQGRGVGTRLLRALTERAVRSGARSLLLEVRADNAAAIALYQREGFERVSVRRRYYQPGDVDAWVLRRRPLPAPGEGRIDD